MNNIDQLCFQVFLREYKESQNQAEPEFIMCPSDMHKFSMLLIEQCLQFVTDQHKQDEMLAYFGIVDKGRW